MVSLGERDGERGLTRMTCGKREGGPFRFPWRYVLTSPAWHLPANRNKRVTPKDKTTPPWISQNCLKQQDVPFRPQQKNFVAQSTAHAAVLLTRPISCSRPIRSSHACLSFCKTETRLLAQRDDVQLEILTFHFRVSFSVSVFG